MLGKIGKERKKIFKMRKEERKEKKKKAEENVKRQWMSQLRYKIIGGKKKK